MQYTATHMPIKILVLKDGKIDMPTKEYFECLRTLSVGGLVSPLVK